MSRFVDSLKESYSELVTKVTWPTWPNLISTTVLVLIASVIFALAVLLMDVVAKQVLELIYGLG